MQVERLFEQVNRMAQNRPAGVSLSTTANALCWPMTQSRSVETR